QEGRAEVAVTVRPQVRGALPGLPQVVGTVVAVPFPGGDDQPGGAAPITGRVLLGEGTGDLLQVRGGLRFVQAQRVQPVLAEGDRRTHGVAQTEDPEGLAVDARPVGDLLVLRGQVRVVGEDVGEVPVAAGDGRLA